MRVVSKRKNAVAAGAFFCLWAADLKAQTGPEWDLQRLVWRCGAAAREEGLTGDAAGEFTQNCIDKNSKPQRRHTATRNSPTQVSDGIWTYGVHSILGLSAHVQRETHALGIACHRKDDGILGDSIAIRITPSLAPHATKSPGVVTFLEGRPAAAFAGIFQDRGSFFETIGMACGKLDDYARARTKIFTRVEFVSMNWTNDRTTTKIKQNGTELTIETDRDLPKLEDVIRMPMAGSRAAISRLMAACPAIRRELANECGIGH